MKPCRDVDTIQRLIENHRAEAAALTETITWHIERIKLLEDYVYELQKPGFKVRGWIRLRQPGRIEPYIITATDFKDRYDYGPDGKRQGDGKHKKGKARR